MTNHLLPNNATAPERAMSLTVARMSDIPVPLRDSWNPETCPVALLPWLAWAFSVDNWDTNWSEAQKRGAINASVFVHRHKGTRAGLQAALDALGYETSIVEWQQMTPPGDPYTFSIEIELFDEGISTPKGYEAFIGVINAAKNVRSHLAALNVRTTRNCEIFGGGVALCGETISIRAEA